MILCSFCHKNEALYHKGLVSSDGGFKEWHRKDYKFKISDTFSSGCILDTEDPEHNSSYRSDDLFCCDSGECLGKALAGEWER